MQPIKHTKKALALALSSVICSYASVAQTSDERIDQLEQQVQNLQTQVNKPDDNRLRFNGFLSVGYGLASNDGGYAGYTEEGSFNPESLFGLQGAFTLTDKTEVTMQLVGRGNDDWDPSIEWAYISHQFTPVFKMRAGKMRLPLFMYSDSLEVGYAQPWIRPPEEVYGNVPVTSYTGIDGLYDVNFDMSTLTFQAFMGESEEDISNLGQAVRLEVNDLFGGSATWTDFIWTLRGNLATSEITIGGDDLKTDFYGLGASYNNGSLQVISEFTRLEIEGPTPDTDSGYITLAYTFGSLAPYFTYSMQESTDDDERPYSREFIFNAINTPGSPLFGQLSALALSDVQNSERTAYSLGLRWDAMSNVAVKFDVTRATDFGDTGGDLPGNVAPSIAYDDIDVYSIKIDSAF
ncbi:porin [Gilvimarinus sp. DA14]|uniref:porin n=1 Tax=Gilvimarinus sp. DA14 TaxID=2956798 RepID=UPI0020B698A3|nr:porin [Gilvimarinus sp. DA14]UTF59534.1 porin [Gilvimarinus sp. DA14]